MILMFPESRPIRCYHKLSSDPAEEEAELLFCRYTDDICVYAWLRHEDGEASMMTIVVMALLHRSPPRESVLRQLHGAGVVAGG